MSKDWKVVEKSIGQSKHNTQLTWKTLKDEECFVENRFFCFFSPTSVIVAKQCKIEID